MSEVRIQVEANEVMIMTEDKETLKQWRDKMFEAKSKTKGINTVIKYFQGRVVSYQERLDEALKTKADADAIRKEYSKILLGRVGSDEEIIDTIENKLQKIYFEELLSNFQDLSSKSISECLTSKAITPIIDAFIQSQKPFLILHDVYHFIVESYPPVKVGLIVSKTADCPKIIGCASLTDIKKISATMKPFRLDDLDRVLWRTPLKMNDLLVEIFDILNQKNFKDGEIVAFKAPYKIRSQKNSLYAAGIIINIK